MPLDGTTAKTSAAVTNIPPPLVSQVEARHLLAEARALVRARRAASKREDNTAKEKRRAVVKENAKKKAAKKAGEQANALALQLQQAAAPLQQ